VHKSFEPLKKNIIEASMLVFIDFNEVFWVHCDVSVEAIGILLSQEGRPLVYSNENLNEVWENYLTYDKGSM